MDINNIKTVSTTMADYDNEVNINDSIVKITQFCDKIREMGFFLSPKIQLMLSPTWVGTIPAGL